MCQHASRIEASDWKTHRWFFKVEYVWMFMCIIDAMRNPDLIAIGVIK